MSNYQYRNNPSTALSGSVTIGATTISVTSGTAFPALGKFTIIVDSEIMLVTGVAGAVWTVTRGTEGTSAATHNPNATVTGILTVASLLDAHHFDVRNYGAKGDGATNDSAAVQAAIAAASVAGGVVKFPPDGTFPVNELTVTSPNVILRGSGPSTLLSYNGASNGKLIHITAANCAVEDMSVRDNGIFSNCLISLNKAGSTKLAGLAARRLTITCTAAASNGICLGYSSDGVVEECTLTNTATTAAETSAYGIHIQSTDPNTTDDSIIARNRITGFYHGISSSGTGVRLGIIIDGNVIKSAIQEGIWGYHAARGRIINNTVEGGAEGMFVDLGGANAGFSGKGEGGICSNNRVYGCSAAGIRLEQLIGGSCTDNGVDTCGTYGIIIGGGCGYAVISGNTLTNNNIGIVTDRFLTPDTIQIYEINISNNIIKRNASHGILLMGVQRGCLISGNTITDNNTSLGATGSGIRLELDSGGGQNRIVHIVGNIIANDLATGSGGGLAGDQRVGVNALDGTASRVVLIGNYFSGHSTADVANAGITAPPFIMLDNYLSTTSLTTASINVIVSGAPLGKRLAIRHGHSSAAGPITEATTVTWPNGGFGDTSYVAEVTVESNAAAGGVFAWISARTATTVTVQIRNATTGATTNTLHVVGFHD